MRRALALLVLVLPAFGAPVAVAWSTPAAPCWSTSSVTTVQSIGRPFDTSGHHVNTLYGTGSTGTGLTYAWTLISGPNTPTITTPAGSTTTVTGVVDTTAAQPYVFRLTVTDSMSATAHYDLTVGAIGIDANGNVIPVDAVAAGNTTKAFGSIQAIGYNPWCWENERALAAAILQPTYLASVNYNPPPFSVNATGTIAYTYGGNMSATTLNGSITASSTSIVVTDATKLNLSTLPTTPTDIFIENELIRICSVSGNTLTVCYDGRGVARGAFTFGVGPTQYPAASHASGVAVGDSMVTGTSTLFVTDSQRPQCAAGAPGPAGIVGYSTGAVTAATVSGHAVLTGSGTTWTSGNNVIAGNMVIFYGTHGGGTAFNFWDIIESVDSTTQMTLNRPLPAGIDSASFSYKVLTPLYGSFEVPLINDTSVTTNVIQYLQSCESETRMVTGIPYYGQGGGLFDTLGALTGKHFSYKTNVGVTSFTFQPNYYGTGLGLRRIALRSGYTPAWTAANNIDEYWVNDPEVCGGYCWSFGIRAGGGFLGAGADLATNSSTILNIAQLRQFGRASYTAVASTGNCNIADTRDGGSTEAMVGELALFDSAEVTTWNNYLYTNVASWYAWDQACKSVVQTNSWANQTYYNNTGPTVTLNSGNASVTATSGTFSNVPNDNSTVASCNGTVSGTGTATAGSDAFHILSGTLPTSGLYEIVITGTRLGSSYTLATDYQYNASNPVLSALWPVDADSGTVSWLTIVQAGGDSSPQFLTFATGTGDTAGLAENFYCTYVDSTHITLNRPWPLANSSTRTMYSGVLAGSGAQPFMLGGAKSVGLNYGAENPDATIGPAFTANAQAAAGWMHSTGFDPYLLSPFSGKVFQLCEPTVVPSSNYAGQIRQAACASGNDPSLTVEQRELTGESTMSIVAYVTSQSCSPAAITWADQQYGSLWAKTGYQTGGVYNGDANTAGNNTGASSLTDASLGEFKWVGFHFGMGMADRYPAVRAQCLAGGGGGSIRSGNVVTGGNVATQ